MRDGRAGRLAVVQHQGGQAGCGRHCHHLALSLHHTPPCSLSVACSSVYSSHTSFHFTLLDSFFFFMTCWQCCIFMHTLLSIPLFCFGPTSVSFLSKPDTNAHKDSCKAHNIKSTSLFPNRLMIGNTPVICTRRPIKVDARQTKRGDCVVLLLFKDIQWHKVRYYMLSALETNSAGNWMWIEEFDGVGHSRVGENGKTTRSLSWGKTTRQVEIWSIEKSDCGRKSRRL